MQEIELKFLVPEYKVDSLMRQVKIKTSESSQLAAHYFDTKLNTLADQGMALRIRKEGENWVQTLKSGGDGLAARGEQNDVLDEQEVLKAFENDELQPDLSLYDDSDFAKPLSKLKISGNDNPLDRLYVTDVHRTTRLLKKEGNVVEIAYDEGKVIHGHDSDKHQPIHEIEFELVQGDVKFLFESAKIWCKRYKLCVSTVTKAERGGLLLADKEHANATKADLNQLNVDKSMTQPEFMRAVVHNCMIQILPNASAIAAGSPDGNHVHQLRVGLRRLRTALKFFDGFSYDINPEWIPIIKQTFSLLGEYRDREVLQLKTQGILEDIGGPYVDWSPERNSLKITPSAAVRANDFQITLLELIEYTMSDADKDKSETDNLVIDSTSKILNKLYKKITNASTQFAQLDVESQHDVRKRLKSLRYLCEFVAPLYKKKQTKQFLKYLEPVQDELGEYNDDLVGHEFYLEKTKTDPNAWFAVGYFAAHKQRTAEKCAESLVAISDAPTFW